MERKKWIRWKVILIDGYTLVWIAKMIKLITDDLTDILSLTQHAYWSQQIYSRFPDNEWLGREEPSSPPFNILRQTDLSFQHIIPDCLKYNRDRIYYSRISYNLDIALGPNHAHNVDKLIWITINRIWKMIKCILVFIIP